MLLMVVENNGTISYRRCFYELARKYYQEEFEGRQFKFYRVSSAIYNLNPEEASFVYIRFNLNGEQIDYVDVRNHTTLDYYDEAIVLENKIPFHPFKTIRGTEWN